VYRSLLLLSGSVLPQIKASSVTCLCSLGSYVLVLEDVLGPNTSFFFHRKRLKAKNLMYIKQILYLLERFVVMLGGKQAISLSVDA